ncbi:MAG TPA: MarR family transcriptional regulator [Dehalococcoidia bacterium]|jgi:MarR family 2-MHQ and catechol resistance regulon transcriptional repressor|nr:MarR family transcriptional regulator [Dehalococcoidia bacterium]
MPGPRNNRKASYAARTARLYAEAFEWADQPGIEASIAVNGAYNAQMAALARLCTALGVNRTMGRHALLRLLHFADQKRMTQFEIAAEMQVTSSNVTFLVDGLEKEGLVQRLPHPSDRRTVYVQLTSEGEALSGIIVPSMARFMAGMLEGFDGAEKQQLVSLLDRLRLNAERFDAKALD